MIWSRLLELLAKALGPLLAGLGVYIAGHRAGSQKAIIKSKAKADKLRKKADEIDEEIGAESAADFHERVFRGADPD